jgi:two-component system, chemotaxis family, protein-glutamate methylesterase/glutaminase
MMQPRHLVVIGTSAGGIEALRGLVAGLPADFPAAIAIVLHTSPQAPDVLHHILSRSGPLSAVSPPSAARLQAGGIYVAPPDFHLLVEPGRVRVAKGPKENRFRPAIDPLFRSAAQVYGPNAIGVILTGNLDDGSAGLWTVKQLGGVAIVQDPDDAMFPSMPQSALDYVKADHVVPLREIAPLLVRLTAHPGQDAAFRVPDRVEVEVKIANQEDPLRAGVKQLGEPSSFACPECHGVLLQLNEGNRIRFRCHTGHAYSAESLLAEIQEQVEVQLWNAIRAMQEGDLLMRAMAEHVDAEHSLADATTLRERADELHRQANTLRQMVTSGAAPAHAE